MVSSVSIRDSNFCITAMSTDTIPGVAVEGRVEVEVEEKELVDLSAGMKLLLKIFDI